MMWNDGWSSGEWVAMGLVMLAFLAVVVAALVVLLRSDRSALRGEGDGGSGGGLRVLDERFAGGEIDADDYTKRRDLLRSK
jgi:putative membrane protein